MMMAIIIPVQNVGCMRPFCYDSFTSRCFIEQFRRLVARLLGLSRDEVLRFFKCLSNSASVLKLH